MSRSTFRWTSHMAQCFSGYVVPRPHGGHKAPTDSGSWLWCLQVIFHQSRKKLFSFWTICRMEDNQTVWTSTKLFGRGYWKYRFSFVLVCCISTRDTESGLYMTSAPPVRMYARKESVPVFRSFPDNSRRWESRSTSALRKLSEARVYRTHWRPTLPFMIFYVLVIGISRFQQMNLQFSENSHEPVMMCRALLSNSLTHHLVMPRSYSQPWYFQDAGLTAMLFLHLQLKLHLRILSTTEPAACGIKYPAWSIRAILSSLISEWSYIAWTVTMMSGDTTVCCVIWVLNSETWQDIVWGLCGNSKAQVA